ncbi:2-amino-4-hydroxy-6-hydroxymethyldihydropteridine diphosphokinase [Paenibacillus lemnae]|uniref:2-amino-4-hydroxy-6-hydroxymethyldihydropteridine diphosphokinase n=1 Tax=Paenibacillus lemnae TaxID=1330551 RepID=A0A848MAS9_PAELE|nr:2-amino-4-hydroxy-6-hydroxymethyldihydropteridine diphosphokinase [Paenibacillus lemnae]NMO97775.1 2-amino-4-hydroxy-6-hydroxymethyldihydropteridine diphosphokinase [Paenibacillus lemnae]
MNTHATSDFSEAYIALGANLGNREATLIEALKSLDQHKNIHVLRCSGIYETEPVGYVDQPMFLNMAAAISTSLPPLELLSVMQTIENRLGRKRMIHWGPRTVDLDLLWMEGCTMNTEKLVLPHPRMLERAFVLMPLAEVVPGSEPSGLHTTVKTALERLEGKEGIQLWKTCSWPSESALSGN